jgi:DNA-binding NarL/FixJ family response regulator
MLILIVDDHDLVREGLRQVLKALDEGVQILEAASCESAFGLAQQYPELDLVLLDYHLPDMDGLSALEVLGRKHPELPVIVLSGSSSPHLERRVIDCGGAGFVSKNGLSQQLLGVVKRVLDGEVPVLCGNTPATASPDAPTDTPASRLTPRQAEVLRLLLDGQSNKDISRALQLSEETVKNHVSGILRVFGVQTRVQAVLAAKGQGYSGSLPAA